jgi:hypothetical protein
MALSNSETNLLSLLVKISTFSVTSVNLMVADSNNSNDSLRAFLLGSTS